MCAGAQRAQARQTSNGLAELQHAATAFEWVICQQADGRTTVLGFDHPMNGPDGVPLWIPSLEIVVAGALSTAAHPGGAGDFVAGMSRNWSEGRCPSSVP